MPKSIQLVMIVLLATRALSACAGGDDRVAAEHANDHEHPEAQSSGSADEVPLYDNLGEYHRSIDTDVALAQSYFDQGLRLQYAFNHAEAIRSYREAVRLDPACAMCWWGIALALGPNINAPMDSAAGAEAWSAITKARDYGLLGKDILHSGFDFDLEVYQGAGAFVCGEETALIQSIEGKRGMPRPRPPFPAQKGLWDRPTVINNVETFANIAQIICLGGDWYAGIGTETSKGTKIFALTGDVNNIGLVEVPMGTTLKNIIFDIGGGIPKKRKFKAVQLGGPSGGCIPADLIDTPVDFESISKVGAIMGSGGMIVMDDRTCMVDMARFFMDFIQEESCGKCTPCREGTARMLEILETITKGEGKPEDIGKLEELSKIIMGTALCGLGQTGPNPVLSTLRYFRDEYEAHIRDKRCPAKNCAALLQFEVDDDMCIKCGRCFKECPAGAISWQKKETARIDREKCIQCMSCFRVCPSDAIN